MVCGETGKGESDMNKILLIPEALDFSVTGSNNQHPLPLAFPLKLI